MMGAGSYKQWRREEETEGKTDMIVLVWREGGKEGRRGNGHIRTCLNCLGRAGDGDLARLLVWQLLIDLNDGFGFILDLAVGERGRE